MSLIQTVKKAIPRQDYGEEFQNLLTRQDILNEELDNIQANIHTLDKKWKKEQQQIQNITKKESHLVRQTV